jgi:type II secretory pathway component GspD/PulD (secretin)
MRRKFTGRVLGLLFLSGCHPRDSLTGLPPQPGGFFTPPATGVVDLSKRQLNRPPPPLEPVIVPQGERSTLIYHCRNSRSEDLARAIDGLVSPEGTIEASGPLNALVVHDRTENVQSMLEVVRRLDHPVNQLLVEARVLEVTLDQDLETEIRHFLSVAGDDSVIQTIDTKFDTPGANPLLGQGLNLALRTIGADDVKLDNFIRLLLTRGKARILSSPNLVVSPGTEASIITGQEVPIQSVTTVGSSQSTTTTFKRVGIKLRVNLLQLAGDTARLELNPEVSTVIRFITSGQVQGQEVQNPIVAIRNITSTLSLKDGEILTVGGLLSSEDRLLTRGIPGLQDIPVAGLAFQSRREQQVRTQVIFFLRVHIIPAGEPGQIRVLNPDAGFRAIDAMTGATTLPSATQPADAARSDAP